nr:MAG TPA: hypothetical protein [Caudoviricetes sp.]
MLNLELKVIIQFGQKIKLISLEEFLNGNNYE